MVDDFMLFPNSYFFIFTLISVIKANFFILFLPALHTSPVKGGASVLDFASDELRDLASPRSFYRWAVEILWLSESFLFVLLPAISRLYSRLPPSITTTATLTTAIKPAQMTMTKIMNGRRGECKEEMCANRKNNEEEVPCLPASFGRPRKAFEHPLLLRHTNSSSSPSSSASSSSSAAFAAAARERATALNLKLARARLPHRRGCCLPRLVEVLKIDRFVGPPLDCPAEIFDPAAWGKTNGSQEREEEAPQEGEEEEKRGESKEGEGEGEDRFSEDDNDADNDDEGRQRNSREATTKEGRRKDWRWRTLRVTAASAV
jgi:hypothetical protein